MPIIEKSVQENIDGNQLTTIYYDNGDVRKIEVDANGHETLNQLINEDGEVVKSITRTFFENGQQSHQIETGEDNFYKETRWREDGQETFYRYTYHIDEDEFSERMYEFSEDGKLKKYTEKDSRYSRDDFARVDEYDENGNILYSRNRGTLKKYFPSGQLAYTEELTGYGKGSCESYYENGVLEYKVVYDEDQLVYKEQRRQDDTLIYSFSKNGEREERDIEEFYDEGGKLIEKRSRINYGSGTRTIHYFENGEIKSIRQYNARSYGVFEDYLREFDDQGRVIKVEDYHGKKIHEITYDGSKKTDHVRSIGDTLYIGGIGNIAVKNGTQVLQYENGYLLSDVVRDADGKVVWEQQIEYYDIGKKRSDIKHMTVGEAKKDEIFYYENGKIAMTYKVFKSDEGYIRRRREYNSNGEMTHFSEGPEEGEVTEMREYDETGMRLLRSIETLDKRRIKYVDYTGPETIETVRDKAGNILSTAVISYHENGKIATSHTTSKKNLSEETVGYNKDGEKIFEQRVGAFGRLLKLYEAYPNGLRKHQIKMNEDGSEEETFWNESGECISYQKRNLDDTTSNKTYYQSGRIQLESMENGVVVYWDSEQHNVKEKRDIRGKVIYKEYANGQKAFEKHSDGTSTEWYETGEILSQTDIKGNKTIFFRNGQERMSIASDGTKCAKYGDEQFLLISGRHCDKCGENYGLTELGVQQAENIGKLIAYASQGKVKGLPNIILPEAYSVSHNSRSQETVEIIMQTVNSMVPNHIKCDEVEGFRKGETCKHNACSELSIHSIGPSTDIADGYMGSIAFSVIGRDGFVVDRVVFNAKEIAQQVEEIEAQEDVYIQDSTRTQEITDKFEEVRKALSSKSESKSGILPEKGGTEGAGEFDKKTFTKPTRMLGD